LSHVFFDQPTTSVIAAARLLLASFALLAIWLDPTQPEHYPAFTYGLLVLYLLFAVTVVGWARLRRHPLPLEHIIDVAAIGLLIYLTQGPTSPFFVLTSFALISGTLQWGARGALGTAAALAFIQLLVTVVEGVTEIDRFVMRGGYLIVGAILFAYYGAYRDRTRERLAQLAAWPAEDVAGGDLPNIQRSLAHAAKVMNCDRVAVVAAIEGEPLSYVNAWNAAEQANTTLAAIEIENDIAAEIADSPFAAQSPQSREVWTPAGSRQLERAAVGDSLARTLHLTGRFASAPFETMTARGRVFFLDTRWFAADMLALAEIVANRIGNEIHEHLLRREVQNTALVSMRQRLADDLHDSTLQVMTASALELQSVGETIKEPEVRDALAAVRRQLAAHQRTIRLFATALRIGGTEEQVQLAGAVDRILSRIESIWKCRAEAQVRPQTATVPSDIQEEVEFILMEAAANACRHGKATRLMVDIDIDARELILRIRNDGKTPEKIDAAGDGDAAGSRFAVPRTIENRVASKKGVVNFSSTAEDMIELHITLPIS
jgi:signal transduction histidine kinase